MNSQMVINHVGKKKNTLLDCFYHHHNVKNNFILIETEHVLSTKKNFKNYHN